MAVPVRYWNKCCRRCPRSFCSDAAKRELESKHSCLKTERQEERNQTLQKLLESTDILLLFPRGPALPAVLPPARRTEHQHSPAALAPGLQAEQPRPRAGGAMLPRSSSGSPHSQVQAFRKVHTGPALHGGNLVPGLQALLNCPKPPSRTPAAAPWD